LAALRRQNPWWREGDWERQDRLLTAAAQAPFSYDPRPLAGVAPGNVFTLLGPRRVGKSTAVKVAIRELIEAGYPPQRIVYYSCDLLEHARELAGLLTGVYDEASDGGLLAGPDRPFYIFLDEVQGIPGWQQAIKSLHDTHRLAADCVVLTGSSSRDLRTGSDLLPGRRGRTLDRDRRLLPMSFRAFAQALAPDVLLPDAGFTPLDLVEAHRADSPVRKALERPRVTAALGDLVDLFEQYARVGGFPGAVADYARTRDVQASTLLEMWDVVRGDLNRYYQVRDPTIPLKVLERLALNLASPVSWQKVAREADVDVKTVQAYVELFSDAHLFLVVHRWEQGTFARRADKKVYPLDPLVAHLAAVVNGRDRFAPDPTRAVESLLAVGLFRATEAETFAAFGVQQGVLYYRTSTNREIDFLVGSSRAPFESKYADSVDRRDVQVMEQAFGRGVLATKRTLDLGGKTVLIPAPLILTMLAYRA
jgi:predicted AAA+ superfamily ATPase